MNNRPVQMKINPLNGFYKRHTKVLNSLLMCIAVFVLGELVLGVRSRNWGTFLSVSQILITIRLAAFTAVFALCQQCVISAGGGGLDLSIGYVATLAGILGGHLMNGSNSGLLPAIMVAVLIGCGFGFFNGILASYIKLPSLVVTMAVGNIVQGIINAYTAKVPIEGYAAPMLNQMCAKFTGVMPNIIFFLVFLLIVVYIIYAKTKIGVKVLGVGSNEVAAHLSGVNVKRVRCIAFIISGIIAALGGLLLLGYLGHAAKDMGSNYVMPSIVVVVVGGISIDGGESNFGSVFLATIFLQSMTNLFVALGWGDAGKWLGYGLILIIMLTAYIRNKRVR